MAVPNTLLYEKWTVADWDEWKELPESTQYKVIQQFYFKQKKNKQKTISHKKK